MINVIRIDKLLWVFTLVMFVSLLGCVVIVGKPPVMQPTYTQPDWVIERNTPFNNYNQEYAPLLTVDDMGNTYVVDTLNNSFTLAKYSTSGTLQWEKVIDPNHITEYGYSQLGAIILDADELYLLWMSVTDVVSWDTDWVLAKYDVQGNLHWKTHQTTPGGGYDVPYGMHLGDNGLLYVYGFNDPDKDKLGDAFLVIAAYDLQGNQVWQDNNKIGLMGFSDATRVGAYYQGGRFYLQYYGDDKSAPGTYSRILLTYDVVGAKTMSQTGQRLGYTELPHPYTVFNNAAQIYADLSGAVISFHAGQQLQKHASDGTLLWQIALTAQESNATPHAGYINDAGETLVVVESKQDTRLNKFDSDGQSVFSYPLSFYFTDASFELHSYYSIVEDLSGRIIVNKIVSGSDGSVSHILWNEIKILDQLGAELATVRVPYSFGFYVPFLMETIIASSVAQSALYISAPSWVIYRYDIDALIASQG